MKTERKQPIRIGSRGSDLALWQANFVSGHIADPTEIIVIKTKGDRILNTALQGQADKGFFTKEIEDALLEGRVDLAVHSLKDLPTILPDGLQLGAVSARGPVPDVLLVRPEALDKTKLIPVKDGGVIGATSLRRQALLRRFAPELAPTLLRGNVPTRLEKLRKGDYDAIIIAQAGLERLQLPFDGLAAYILNPEIWLPAPGQAVLGIEIRDSDADIINALGSLHSDRAWREVGIERELLARFEGGCHAAFGAWARIDDGQPCVLVGHEDAGGVWRMVRVEGDTDAELCDAAYKKLKAVMDSGCEVDPWDGVLASPWQR